jgi:hypothetical protein
VELGWAVEVETGYPAKYMLTDIGRAAVAISSAMIGYCRWLPDNLKKNR